MSSLAARVPLCTCHLTCAPLPAALCFAVTRSLMLTCLVPAGLLALRYYYSRKVILAYLECALHTDMADIEQYYMKPPGEFWNPPTLPPSPSPSSSSGTRGPERWDPHVLSLLNDRGL